MRENCGGIWATATWAQSYWGGHIQCGGEPPPPDSRTNCGGIWGTATWAQAYWGSHVQCPEPPPPTPETRTWCGGIWATATWAQIYFGGHIQCPIPAPPIPPVPPEPSGGGVGGIGARGRRHVRLRPPNPRDFFPPQTQNYPDEPSRPTLKDVFEHPSIDDGDEEDLMTILALWMNIK